MNEDYIDIYEPEHYVYITLIYKEFAQRVSLAEYTLRKVHLSPKSYSLIE